MDISGGDGAAVVGFEALARWEHPERGLVSPAEFVPLAEETGLILPLGRRVLGEACRQLKEWQDLYPADPPLKMGVNLSALQLREPGLLEDAARVLAETGLDPATLVLEITEGILTEDTPVVLATLRYLKLLGARLAVDDFGTGYSSLAYLKRFPVDYLKIDRSFVSGLGRDRRDEGLVSAIVELARALGLETTAEGVETEGQLGRLHALGCGLAQGFYFSKPLPGGAASALLSASASPNPSGLPVP
ncbi:MAG: EAL domain-containing protein [Actinomycetota bacterium]|nr:EAL domain-containing protein [Actinomycetota bacterium]